MTTGNINPRMENAMKLAKKIMDAMGAFMGSF